jgi:hypothetical protein
MPISSFSAPSAIAKPGVVANAAARPASPYDGQVIYQQDTDQAYVWNGSAWVLLSTGTANPPGLELVTSQTIGSAVSSVTVSNCFSSTYDNYRIILSGGAASTAAMLKMTIGSASTNYYWSFLYSTWGGTTASADTGNIVASFSYVGQITTRGLGADISVLSPFLTNDTLVSAQTYFGSGSYSGQMTGGLATATSYTSFTLTTNSGTMTGGTIVVYGYRKP